MQENKKREEEIAAEKLSTSLEFQYEKQGWTMEEMLQMQQKKMMEQNLLNAKENEKISLRRRIETPMPITTVSQNCEPTPPVISFFYPPINNPSQSIPSNEAALSFGFNSSLPEHRVESNEEKYHFKHYPPNKNHSNNAQFNNKQSNHESTKFKNNFHNLENENEDYQENNSNSIQIEDNNKILFSFKYNERQEEIRKKFISVQKQLKNEESEKESLRNDYEEQESTEKQQIETQRALFFEQRFQIIYERLEWFDRSFQELFRDFKDLFQQLEEFPTEDEWTDLRKHAEDFLMIMKNLEEQLRETMLENEECATGLIDWEKRYREVLHNFEDLQQAYSALFIKNNEKEKKLSSQDHYGEENLTQWKEEYLELEYKNAELLRKNENYMKQIEIYENKIFKLQNKENSNHFISEQKTLNEINIEKEALYHKIVLMESECKKLSLLYKQENEENFELKKHSKNIEMIKNELEKQLQIQQEMLKLKNEESQRENEKNKMLEADISKLKINNEEIFYKEKEYFGHKIKLETNLEMYKNKLNKQEEEIFLRKNELVLSKQEILKLNDKLTKKEEELIKLTNKINKLEIENSLSNKNMLLFQQKEIEDLKIELNKKDLELTKNKGIMNSKENNIENLEKELLEAKLQEKKAVSKEKLFTENLHFDCESKLFELEQEFSEGIKKAYMEEIAQLETELKKKIEKIRMLEQNEIELRAQLPVLEQRKMQHDKDNLLLHAKFKELEKKFGEQQRHINSLLELIAKKEAEIETCKSTEVYRKSSINDFSDKIVHLENLLATKNKVIVQLQKELEKLIENQLRFEESNKSKEFRIKELEECHKEIPIESNLINEYVPHIEHESFLYFEEENKALKNEIKKLCVNLVEQNEAEVNKTELEISKRLKQFDEKIEEITNINRESEKKEIFEKIVKKEIEHLCSEEQQEYYRIKVHELEERTEKLLELNNILKEKLESVMEIKSNSAVVYYKEHYEKNIKEHYELKNKIQKLLAENKEYRSAAHLKWSKIALTYEYKIFELEQEIQQQSRKIAEIQSHKSIKENTFADKEYANYLFKQFGETPPFESILKPKYDSSYGVYDKLNFDLPLTNKYEKPEYEVEKNLNKYCIESYTQKEKPVNNENNFFNDNNNNKSNDFNALNAFESLVSYENSKNKNDVEKEFHHNKFSWEKSDIDKYSSEKYLNQVRKHFARENPMSEYESIQSEIFLQTEK